MKRRSIFKAAAALIAAPFIKPLPAKDTLPGKWNPGLGAPLFEPPVKGDWHILSIPNGRIYYEFDGENWNQTRMPTG